MCKEIKKRDKRDSGLFIRVFIFQVFVCALTFLFFFILKVIAPSRYLIVSDSLKYAMKGSNVREGFNNVCFNLRKFFSNASNTFFIEPGTNMPANEHIKTLAENNIVKDECFNHEDIYNPEIENFNKINIETESNKDSNKQANEADAKTEKKTNQLQAEQPKAEQPMAEQPKAEKPKAKQPPAEQPKAEQPKIEPPKKEKLEFKYPLKGKISSGYGERENPLKKGEKDFHHGVDILVKKGTPIFAVADGVVSEVSKSAKSGNFIFIKHENNYETLYAHCDKILVPKGKNIKQGDKIADSGQTGNVSGPHLHFGVKKDGKWINPKDILPNLK